MRDKNRKMEREEREKRENLLKPIGVTYIGIPKQLTSYQPNIGRKTMQC